jgi:hypothetical protein
VMRGACHGRRICAPRATHRAPPLS